MTTSWKKYLAVFVPLALVVAAPLVLRDSEVEGAAPGKLRLEIITPHNELIRREFGEAFAKWYQEESGESVYVNWRSPGGTSEIKRVLDTAFEAASERGKEGIGIDLFFGGGEYDFSKQAKKGRFARLPDSLFENDIPQTLREKLSTTLRKPGSECVCLLSGFVTIWTAYSGGNLSLLRVGLTSGSQNTHAGSRLQIQPRADRSPRFSK